MVDRAAGALSLPDDWPADPDLSLILNRMGLWDWDLASGLMHMDEPALEVFDVRPEEYDGRPESLAFRVPPEEGARLDAMVAQALKTGSDHYGAYFRIRRRDGSLRWTHTQGRVRRDGKGRPVRIIGIVRDATEELADSSARIAVDIERRRQTSVVESTTAALAHARTVQDVIDVLKDSHGLEHFGATSLVMGLLESGGRIHLVAEGPEGSFVPGTRYTRVDEQYPMSEVVRTLAPRFIESKEDFATSYPVLWPNIEVLGIEAAAYLPLIAQAQPIGALGLLYRDKSGFSAEERNVLVALGSSIAQSLQRAVLYDQEHDLAEGLQQAMLPRKIPQVPGAGIAVRYRSARMGRDVGGDWYDVITLPGGRVGAVIGDVQGHDTDAAAVMGQLRIVLRAYAAEGHTPATVMARASVFLHELDTDRFATCMYAEADLTTGVVQVVRAGHMDPLIRDADGDLPQGPGGGRPPAGAVGGVRAARIPGQHGGAGPRSRRSSCTPTAWSRCPAPIWTTDCSCSLPWSTPAPVTSSCWRTICATWWRSGAVTTTWRCCCSAGRVRSLRGRAAGCVSTSPRTTRRRCVPPGTWSVRRYAPGARASAPTRSNSPRTR